MPKMIKRNKYIKSQNPEISTKIREVSPRG